MDTKLTKFKEKSTFKIICLLLACIFIALSAVNAFPVAEFAACFGTLNKEDATFLKTNAFNVEFNNDLNDITEAVNYNYIKNDFKNQYQTAEDNAVNYYNRIKDTIVNVQADDDYESYNNEDDTLVTTMLENETSKTFSFKIATVNYERNFSVTFTKSDLTDDDVRNLIYNEVYDVYTNDATDFLLNLKTPEDITVKNLTYYAESSDGTVLTNAESKEDVINNLSGNNTFVSFKNGEMTTSQDLKNATFVNHYNEISGTNIYVIINTMFDQNDNYKSLYNNVIRQIKEINVEKKLTLSVGFFAAAMILLIISAYCAGNKNGEIKLAPIDKIPPDLHIVISAAILAGIYVLLVYFCDGAIQAGIYGTSNYTLPYLFEKPLAYVIISAAAVISYLVVFEVVTSVTRSAKTGTFGKNTLIYKLVKAIIKLCKKATLKTKAFFKGIIYKPENFSKKTTATIVLFALFNIVGAAVCTVLYVGGELFAVLGFVFTLAVLGADAYIVYLTVKYLKQLDFIISATAANDDIVNICTDGLPASLKKLATGINNANIKIQNAVVKATKDERTKTELITNVSHDLKTPLTSVINYIDLLKKCEIKDENAQKYMAVIDEKSGKLKRLIEDLIEASKISAGNVTVTKTKLNLNELATQAIVEETSEFEKNNLQIIFDEDDNQHIAYADGPKIYRVLENLLTNAKKYSAPGSRVYASVYTSDNFECFELKNISKTPLNISAKELTERFVRGDKSRSEEGNGLGLSIATELCKLNGGELILSIDGDLFKATVKLPK